MPNNKIFICLVWDLGLDRFLASLKVREAIVTHVYYDRMRLAGFLELHAGEVRLVWVKKMEVVQDASDIVLHAGLEKHVNHLNWVKDEVVFLKCINKYSLKFFVEKDGSLFF